MKTKLAISQKEIDEIYARIIDSARMSIVPPMLFADFKKPSNTTCFVLRGREMKTAAKARAIEGKPA